MVLSMHGVQPGQVAFNALEPEQHSSPLWRRHDGLRLLGSLLPHGLYRRGLGSPGKLTFQLIFTSLGASALMYSRLLHIPNRALMLSQIGQRGETRSRYRIKGSGVNDCLAACCCTPCELTQQSRELDLEERALLGNFPQPNVNEKV